MLCEELVRIQVTSCHCITNVDFDECKTGRHNCSKHLVCVNVPGSYRCVTASWPLPTTTAMMPATTTTPRMSSLPSTTKPSDGATTDDYNGLSSVLAASVTDLPPTSSHSPQTTTTMVMPTTTTTTKTTTSPNDHEMTGDYDSLRNMSSAWITNLLPTSSPSSETTTTTAGPTTTTTTTTTTRSDSETTGDYDGLRNMSSVSITTLLPTSSPSSQHTTTTTTTTTTTKTTTTTQTTTSRSDGETAGDNDGGGHRSISLAWITNLLPTWPPWPQHSATSTTDRSTATSSSTFSQPTDTELNTCRPGYVLNRLTSTCEGNRFCVQLSMTQTFNHYTTVLTHSTPAAPNCCCSNGSVPSRSNPPFLISDIRALWRSVLSARAPECQKITNGGLDQYGKV